MILHQQNDKLEREKVDTQHISYTEHHKTGDEFLLHCEEGSKVMAWIRAGLVFVMNFHPEASFPHYRIPAAPGSYRIVLDTDRSKYGGFDRQADGISHHTIPDLIQRHFLSLYLPSRTGLVLAPE